MSRPERHFDWHCVISPLPRTQAVDSRRRLRWLLAGFLLAMMTVFARAAWLEVAYGKKMRLAAARELTRQVVVKPRRGRILTRDGTVLAIDVPIQALEVHYRWLEHPPNPAWLKQQALARLRGADRRDEERLLAEQSRVLVERAECHRRLVRLCGISPSDWRRACQRVQTRVERIQRSVNRRQSQRQFGNRLGANGSESKAAPNHSFLTRLFASPSDRSPPIVVREQLMYHELVAPLAEEAAGEIVANPQQFPGARIATRKARSYPQGPLAAHVVGHLGAVGPEELANGKNQLEYAVDDWLGRLGVERQYEPLLRGRPGLQIETLDRSGEVLAIRTARAAASGRDVVLSIDAALQLSAERLLHSALARRLPSEGFEISSGGAIVVLDCRDGALLVSASAPRFDPGAMLASDSERLDWLLKTPGNPFLNRVAQMAIPPGSVMKMISAVALLEEKVVTPSTVFACQGYLRTPDRQRCELFRRQGIGHGRIDLVEALAQSCNVYFFHHAEQLGMSRLVSWARTFGLGRPTGIDLPAEAPGQLPRVSASNASPMQSDAAEQRNVQAAAIGQSTLGVTPLQVARATAALANGGFLIRPYVAQQAGNAVNPSERLRLPVKQAVLTAVRHGMEQAVSAPGGTAASMAHPFLAIAAKTGTAQTGAGRPAHAWVTAYLPADRPQLVLVVALEHAADASESAYLVVKRLIVRMEELGYFRTPPMAQRASRTVPR